MSNYTISSEHYLPELSLFGGDGVDGNHPLLHFPVERFALDGTGSKIIRRVLRRDHKEAISDVDLNFAFEPKDLDQNTLASYFDYAWLRSEQGPEEYRPNETSVRIADLFSGCGGMTLGIKEACRALEMKARAVVAVDINQKALQVYAHNFPEATILNDPIEELLDSDLGDEPSEKEKSFRHSVGEIDILVGGPPCQGHSSLNNHTRRNDPKNRLYLRMARFAELFEPEHIIIENVIGVRHDDEGVFEVTRKYLEELEYQVTPLLLSGEVFGVPQTRKRVFLIASKKRKIVDRDRLAISYHRPTRTFRWACDDLVDIVPQHIVDEPSKPKAVTQERLDYLFDNGLYELPDEQRPECHKDKKHTYQSVYGRIRWDEPSPTITTGFTTMGQGRFVHPSRRRTITPHEAARAQFFPDFFDFLELNREAHKEIIGNAVPPKMTYVLALELMR